jgi:hypothetical protein
MAQMPAQMPSSNNSSNNNFNNFNSNNNNRGLRAHWLAQFRLLLALVQHEPSVLCQCMNHQLDRIVACNRSLHTATERALWWALGTHFCATRSERKREYIIFCLVQQLHGLHRRRLPAEQQFALQNARLLCQLAPMARPFAGGQLAKGK